MHQLYHLKDVVFEVIFVRLSLRGHSKFFFIDWKWEFDCLCALLRLKQTDCFVLSGSSRCYSSIVSSISSQQLNSRPHLLSQLECHPHALFKPLDEDVPLLLLLPVEQFLLPTQFKLSLVLSIPRLNRIIVTLRDVVIRYDEAIIDQVQIVSFSIHSDHVAFELCILAVIAFPVIFSIITQQFLQFVLRVEVVVYYTLVFGHLKRVSWIYSIDWTLERVVLEG